jgi:hypothetical protein
MALSRTPSQTDAGVAAGGFDHSLPGWLAAALRRLDTPAQCRPAEPSGLKASNDKDSTQGAEAATLTTGVCPTVSGCFQIVWPL